MESKGNRRFMHAAARFKRNLGGKTVAVYSARYVGDKFRTDGCFSSNLERCFCHGLLLSRRLEIGKQLVGSRRDERVRRRDVTRLVNLGMDVIEQVQGIAHNDQVQLLFMDGLKVLDHFAVGALNHHLERRRFTRLHRFRLHDQVRLTVLRVVRC